MKYCKFIFVLLTGAVLRTETPQFFLHYNLPAWGSREDYGIRCHALYKRQVEMCAPMDYRVNVFRSHFQGRIPQDLRKGFVTSLETEVRSGFRGKAPLRSVGTKSAKSW